MHGGHYGHGGAHHCGVFPDDADLHPQRGVYVEKIQSTTDRREYHLRPTQKYIDYYNISYSYLSTVVQRVNKRFPKEDVKKLEQMLTIISNELMPELNLENNPEAPEEKKTAR